MKTSFRFSMMIACAIVARGAAAQTPSIVESAARARAIVDSAVAAHGGVEALNAAKRIHVVLRGQDFWRNQSVNVAPPYDARDAVAELFLDLPAGKMVTRQAGAYPGDLNFASRRFTDGDRSNAVFETSGLYFNFRAPPVANQTGAQFSHLPQLVVLAAYENRQSLRSLGRVRLSSGAIVNAVTVSAGGGSATLGFDVATKRLRALINVSSDVLAGDTTFETEFADYRTIDGVLLPSRRLSYAAGEKTQEMRYVSATPNYTIPDSLLALPAGARARVEDTGDVVRELAPGVWNIRQFRGHVLAVAFHDYVVVVEAPAGSTTAIVEQIAKLAPGKPIRYVVPTHHHDDHSGGVRDYVALGTAIVTTPGNRAYFERMAAAHSALNPDAQAKARRAPKIEVITGGRRVFTDGERTLEIHDIGPNEHAKELLVAWIPEAGILYEGDMLNTALNGDVEAGINMQGTISFANAIKRRGWSVRTFTGLHHPPLPPTALEKILAQPIVTP
jgi:glyoxylase-like metal-dependent hydrolase (beta-lactamase superfamily II)